MTEQEIKIIVFATEMSELLYTMRAESDLGGAMLTTPTTNNAVPHSFIESIVDDIEHIENMKFLIKTDIINHLTKCPNDYKNELDAYHYTSDVYDFSYVVDSYVERLYEDTKETKTIWICSNCGSDNVEAKFWVNINTNKVDGEAMEDDDEYYCEDCKQHHPKVEKKITIPRAKIEGYQVVGNEGSKEEGNIHPDMDASFCIYNLDQANKMLKGESGSLINNLNDWRLLTIWTDDIEEPTMMFEGNVR